MKIATAGSARSKRWRTGETSWDGILRKLRVTTRTGETCAEYRRMTREEQGKKKEAAGGFVGGPINGGRRIAGAVEERHLITLDADEAKVGDWDNATAMNDWAMCAYTTHSHTPEAPRLRWVLPLTRAVSREEYEPLCRQVALDLGILETLDPSTYQPERLMYWPTSCQDGEYLCLVQDGPWVDPDAVLRRYGKGSAWRDVSGWPMASRERDIVRRELKHQEDPTQKRGIVGVFCRTYDIHSAIAEFLPDVYEDAGNDRYTYVAGSTAGGAVVYGDGLWLYSNHATDPAWGQLCNAFDLVRIHKFGELDEGREAEEDVTRAPSYVAMSRWCSELDAVKLAVVNERLSKAAEDFADMGGYFDDGEENCAKRAYVGQGASVGQGEGMTARASTSTDTDEWKSRLVCNGKTGAVEPSVDNIVLILENDPLLRGTMAFNDFSARPVLRGRVPWRAGEPIRDAKNGDAWEDSDDAGLRWYLERYWKIESRQKIQDAWSIIIRRHAFHPVREYLSGLTWDGKERVNTMLVKWMGAEDSPYVRAATRKWMSAAVARVFEPGCKFDQLLVLVGVQGIGKSTLAYTLSQGWFSDSLSGMAGKEALEHLRGVWIVELAELAANKRSEEETVKNYITKRVDTYRPAYGRHVMDFPRQCVFYGTTNDPNIIKDRTGGRRYWPVSVQGFDRGRLTGLESEVDQLWAEAVAIWRSGEARWMDDDELYAATQEAQAEFTLDDEMVGLIREYLDKPLPHGWDKLSIEDRRDYVQGRSTLELGVCDVVRDEVSVVEIRMELLNSNREDIGRGDSSSRRITSILDNLPGWKRSGKVTRRGPYGPQRTYKKVGRRVVDELD